MSRVALFVCDINTFTLEWICAIWLVLARLISHDRDTARGARGMFHTHAPGPGLIHYNAGFYFHIESNSFVIMNHFGQICTYFWKCLRMRMKILFLKRAWLKQADKTRAWPLFVRGMTRAMPSSFHISNNGRARIKSGRTSQARF